MNDLNDLLATVQDKASADAARPKLDALSQRMQALGEQMQKHTGATRDDRAWLEKEFLPGMQTVTAKLKQTMANLQDAEIKKQAGTILTDWMTTAMKKAVSEAK